MRLLGSRSERRQAATDARIREQTAAVALDHQARLNAVEEERARLDLVPLQRKAAAAAARSDRELEAIELRRREERRENRRKRWADWRERVAESVSGRSVLALVALAVVTAWVGQFESFTAGLGFAVPVAVAGASAVELTGLALLKLAHDANRYRDRALRIRLLMWGVIGYAAATNLHHFGWVMAAMSLQGPLVWEVSEWWKRRRRLYDEEGLSQRPVRPRFALDHWLLYPRLTWLAYRVAVREDIAEPRLALAAARAECARRRLMAVDVPAWHRSMAAAVDAFKARLRGAVAATMAVIEISATAPESDRRGGATALELDRHGRAAAAAEESATAPGGNATADEHEAPVERRDEPDAGARVRGRGAGNHRRRTLPRGVSGRRKAPAARRVNRADVLARARAALDTAPPDVISGPWVAALMEGEVDVSPSFARDVAAELKRERASAGERVGPHLVQTEQTA